MRCTIIVLTILCLLAIPTGAAAQPWRDAYNRGDFAKAAELLQPIVFNLPALETFPDPTAAEHLAKLYAGGLGVPADRVMACSLLDLASRSARFQSRIDRPNVQLEKLRDDVCAALSVEDDLEAKEILGCYMPGLERQAHALDAGHWVQISRRGIRVHYREAELLYPLPQISCGQRFAIVRYTRVDPVQANGVAPRHFLEFFVSFSRSSYMLSHRLLFWQLLEIVGRSVEHRGTEMLLDGPGVASPDALVPASMEKVTLKMLEGGEVTWQFDQAPFSGMAAALPLELAPEQPDVFPPLPPGTGYIGVTVTDRSGARLPQAMVTLSGLVTRGLTTDDDGRVAFTELPDGRYDVVASAQGLLVSLPGLIDVAGQPVPPVEIVLKPGRMRNGQLGSCSSPAAPKTLNAFAADSDAVVHVRIERRRTYLEAGSPGSEPEFIWTASEPRWIEFLKSSATVAPGDEIIQFGGRIDRGEYIEFDLSDRLAPLNLGDEYVLFLKRYEGDGGRLRVHHLGEGAFLLRNGRVSPLGKQDVARAWKGRSAAKFLDALRTKVPR
ncbi:MAG: carboxypeptidase-like regulatory domain-containing protein [Vicinamibacterales bacterium]